MQGSFVNFCTDVQIAFNTPIFYNYIVVISNEAETAVTIR